jgi:tRNA(Ile)-lysidine synthase
LLLALIDLKKRKKLDLNIVVAHFNHEFRGKESDADEKFVRELAKKNDLEFVTGSGRIEGASDIEQRARDARYDFLAKTARSKKSKFCSYRAYR